MMQVPSKRNKHKDLNGGRRKEQDPEPDPFVIGTDPPPQNVSGPVKNVMKIVQTRLRACLSSLRFAFASAAYFLLLDASRNSANVRLKSFLAFSDTAFLSVQGSDERHFSSFFSAVSKLAGFLDAIVS